MALFRNSIFYAYRLHFVSKCSIENEDVDIYETNNIRKTQIKNAMNGVGVCVSRYNALLSVDVSSYVCGLNWVLRYYTCGVCDVWWYSSHSGPLLCDVSHSLDALDVSLFRGERLSCMGYTQMAYVLPRESLNLLPPKIERFLLENYSELYPSKCEFEWSYCRYLWESKPLLPEIPLTLLKKWNYQFQLYKENEKDKMLRLDL